MSTRSSVLGQFVRPTLDYFRIADHPGVDPVRSTLARFSLSIWWDFPQRDFWTALIDLPLFLLHRVRAEHTLNSILDSRRPPGTSANYRPDCLG